MKSYINKLTLIIASLLFFFGFAFAKENVGVNRTANNNTPQRVAADCDPASAQTDLAINNVRFRVLTGGDMWWDAASNPQYEIPKVTQPNEVRRHSIFAGALWIGGVDGTGQLKVAAQTYRQTGDDFWPGALDLTTVDITPDRCNFYDRHWVMNKNEVADLVDNGTTNVRDILEYPGNGDPAFNEDLALAPFFDNNGDGVYDIGAGDYPYFNLSGEFPGNECNDFLFGDAALWWVFNDKGNVHTETNGQQIGLEIRSQAFAFATNDEINNMTFYKYQIVNRANVVLNDTYFGQWVDPDLGNFQDDYVGCDVERGLGFCYNGDSDDDGPGGYGPNPPAIGVDFFQGPLADPGDGIDNDRDGVVDELGEQIIMSKFVYYNNVNAAPNGNPDGADHFYNYLQGIWGDGQPMTFGGDGRDPNAPLTDFMFSDGTDPAFPGQIWNEVTAGNVPADRRFLQSAGKFTLQPGAVNYITVGVVWARASSGGQLASVNLMKLADDKAQALFDNCFKVLDGPDAPDMAIRELDKQLIITLEETNTPKIELYAELDPTISAAAQPDSAKRRYYFQGYQIYQLKDASVTTADIGNVDLIRLVAQVDIKDTLSQIVNFSYDPAIGAFVPMEMVNGVNEGLKHSFNITQDAFASGDPTLVNHRTYYFTVVSYATNNFADFDPSLSFDEPNGQNKIYLAGRNNIKTYSGIPHIVTPEIGGTTINAEYGDGPRLQRMEGQGNGGINLDLSDESVAELLASPFHISLNPIYERAAGPANVKVIDPIGIAAGEFELRLNGVTETDTWKLTNLTSGDFVDSERDLATPHEQIIPEWGLSAEVSIVDAVGTAEAIGFGGGIIDNTISFDNDNAQWLSGVPDVDGAGSQDWILAGDDATDLTPDGEWEGLISGTWAPYKLASKDTFGPKWRSVAEAQLKFEFVNSVDIILTSDKSQWTRSAVVEMGFVSALNQDGTDKASLRDGQPSIDKNGRQSGDAGYNAAEGDLTRTTGMGWFPGYAINVETGERLNIAYGENSSTSAYNGRDMIWNPVSDIDGPFDPIYGGGHYIFIFDHNGDNAAKDVPRYDEGKQISDLLTSGSTTSKRDVWKDCIWTSMATLKAGQSLVDGMIPPSDVKIRLRVAKNYESFVSRNEILDANDALAVGTDYYVTSGSVTHSGTNYNAGDVFTAANTTLSGTGTVVTPPPSNDFLPLYKFNNDEIKPSTEDAAVASSALDIIKVVPNPYYAFSGYEKSSLDNRVKITNLPANCTISIFNVNGTLVRKLKRSLDSNNQTSGGEAGNNQDTTVDWDLKNESNIPVGSGIYIIHIDAGSLGEKTVKWFGVMRPIDLVNF